MAITLDQNNIAELHKGSIRNRKYIQSAIKQVKRRINKYLRVNDEFLLKLETLHFASLFLYECEALLLEVISVEGAFTSNEIAGLLSKRSLEEKWKSTFTLAMNRFDYAARTNQLEIPVPNVESHHHRVIDDFNGLFQDHLLGPITIRNKICHGQAVVAFSETWKLNSDITKAIHDLSFSDIETDLLVVEKIAWILGELIKSPGKAHPRDYENEMDILLNEVIRRHSFTVGKKKKSLREKYKRRFYANPGD